MDYEDFADRFLAALYLETETGGQEYHSAKSLIQKYNLELKPHWISRIADDWEHTFFRDVSKVLGGYEGWNFRLSGLGARHVETRLGDEDELRSFFGWDESSPSVSDANASIHSASWTGLPPGFVLNEEKLSAIIRQLDHAERSLGNVGASQHDQSQARAYIVAARALLEAPDPDPEIAWMLISRANQIAGIASLFVSIIALFQAVAN